MTSQKPRRRNSVPQAKNIMRRAVNDIIDPSPPDVGPVWDYFRWRRCCHLGGTRWTPSTRRLTISSWTPRSSLTCELTAYHTPSTSQRART